MRFFLQEERDPGIEGQENDNVRTRTTAGYIELEYKIGDWYADTYVLGRSENTVFVVAPLDHVFDPIQEQIEEKNATALNAEFKAWPTLETFLQNGIKDRYSEGALIQLEDPDCGETKWFIATVIGNLDFDKESDLAAKKIDAATTLVLEKAVQLVGEVSTKKPHYYLHAFWEGIKSGVGEGILEGVTRALSE